MVPAVKLRLLLAPIAVAALVAVPTEAAAASPLTVKATCSGLTVSSRSIIAINMAVGDGEIINKGTVVLFGQKQTMKWRASAPSHDYIVWVKLPGSGLPLQTSGKVNNCP